MTGSRPITIPDDLLSACIHCGMCLPACPTYGVTGSEAESPRGRLYLMKAFNDGTLSNSDQLSTHLDACLGCQACERACPSGVAYGELLMASRDALLPSRPLKKRLLNQFFYRHVLPKPRVLKLLTHVLQRFQALIQAEHIRPYWQALMQKSPSLQWQWTLAPELPAQFSPFEAGQQFDPVGEANGQTVALMTGCVMDAIFHPVHQATIDVLTENGFRVIIPPQTCCGALALHAGERLITESLARTNIQQVLSTQPDYIVLNSAGCGAAMKEYGSLFIQNPALAEDARMFSDKVVDVMVLLSRKPLRPMKRAIEKRVTYHGACHLHHAQQVRFEPYEVILQVEGMSFIPLPAFDRCCGSAGVYNLEQPELSQALLVEKMKAIVSTQAEVILTGNPGCLLQLMVGVKNLSGQTPSVIHPVELLAHAYGRLEHPALLPSTSANDDDESTESDSKT